MKSTLRFNTLRPIVLFVVAAFLGTGLTGCAAINQHMSAFYSGALIRAEHKHDLANVREETREALSKQRQEALRMASQHEIEQARIDAENRRLEMQFCQANQEALQRQVKSNIKDTVETKVNFNVVQGLEAGELEVDVPELQALMKDRDNEALEKPQPKQPCPCCDQPCGCEPGLRRRHCPRCRHKECEAEEKCGGPEALRKLAQEPLKRPLRPAEIPLKLPVRLTFGMHGPEMEAAKIRRTPNIPEALTRQCDRCGNPNPGCDCHLKPAGEAMNRVSPTFPAPVQTSTPINDNPQAPPKPIPDDSARNAPSRSKDGVQNVFSRFVTTNIFTAQRPAQTESAPDRVPRP